MSTSFLEKFINSDNSNREKLIFENNSISNCSYQFVYKNIKMSIKRNIILLIDFSDFEGILKYINENKDRYEIKSMNSNMNIENISLVLKQIYNNHRLAFNNIDYVYLKYDALPVICLINKLKCPSTTEFSKKDISNLKECGIDLDLNKKIKDEPYTIITFAKYLFIGSLIYILSK